MRILPLALLAFAAAVSCAQPGPDEAALLRPEALVELLQKQPRPTILYVGPPVLYRASHIPGAQLAGPASRPEGLEALKAAVKGLKRDAAIVIYCGCCPWNDCPNVRPAYRVLRDMGFRRAKVLYIPTNLRTDWTGKGYPVERAAGPDERFGR